MKAAPRHGLRVAVVTDAVEVGGAEISASHLVGHVAAETTVSVIGVDAAVVRRIAGDRASEVAVLRPPRGPTDVGSVIAHARALARARPDVIHLSLASPWSCQHALVAALALPRTPVVAVYQLTVPPVSRRQLLEKRLTSRRVTVHVAVGRAAAREVEEAIGLRPGSVRVIHNAVPDVVSQSARAVAAPGTGTTIVAVGRLERQKGFDVLLDALAELPDASAVIVGEGSERDALVGHAAGLGLEDRVRFAGWLASPGEMLASAGVFVLPSRFEGFPLAIVEAMLHAVPVVATSVGSVPEAVVSEHTGLLVPPEDAGALAGALRRLLDDAALRERLGTAGRALARCRFTADVMAGAYDDLYRELLA